MKDCFVMDMETGDHFGVLTLSVEAGHSWLVDSEGLPWKFAEPDEEAVAALCAAVEFADCERRTRAALAVEEAGVYEGIDKEKVLSVRLNDYCEHDKKHWVPKACSNE